ncbi:protein transporter tim9 [Entophlyctis sp. JEL0112]|nr:protein transporter tim9 [Entophlyctis sp. JEL0112]
MGGWVRPAPSSTLPFFIVGPPRARARFFTADHCLRSGAPHSPAPPATTPSSPSVILQSMRNNVAAGKYHAAIAECASLLNILSHPLEAAGEINALEKIAATVASSHPALHDSSDSPLLSSVNRVLLLRKAKFSRSELSSLAHQLSNNILENSGDQFAGANLTRLKIDVVKLLLEDNQNDESSFMALKILRSFGPKILEADSDATFLIIKAFSNLRCYNELEKFLESSSVTFNYLALAEATKALASTAPEAALSCFMKAKSDIQNKLPTVSSSLLYPEIPSQNTVSQSTKTVASAISAVMKILADRASFLEATALSVELSSIFQISSDAGVTRLGLHSQDLLDSVKNGFLSVLLSTIRHGQSKSCLDRNNLTIKNILDISFLYVQNVLKTSASNQETYRRIMQIYIECIQIELEHSKLESDAKFSLEGAVKLFEDFRTMGYKPSVNEFNDVLQILSKPPIPPYERKSPSLSRTNRIGYMKSIYESMLRSGVSPTGKTFAHMYRACCADADHAFSDHGFLQKLVSSQQIAHTHSSTASLLRTYIRSGLANSGMTLWNDTRIVRANEMSELLYSKTRKVNVGNNVEGKMRKPRGKSVSRDLSLYKTIAKAASRSEKFAGYVLSDVRYEAARDGVIPDLELYNHYLSCAVAARDVSTAHALMDEMRAANVPPDAHSFRFLLRLVFGRGRDSNGVACAFGRTVLRDARVARVRVRGDVMGWVADWYCGDAGRAEVNAEVVEDIIRVTDFESFVWPRNAHVDLRLDGLGSPEPLEASVRRRLMDVFKDNYTSLAALVDSCFKDCVNDFTSKALSGKEETCINRCTEKFLKFSMRVDFNAAAYHMEQQKSAGVA